MTKIANRVAPPMTLQTKGAGPLVVTDADKGTVEAIVATLDVVDRDGDVIRRSAFVSPARVKLSDWGHSAVRGDAPVGKGVIEVEGSKAVFRGRIFLNTEAGRETFATLKELDSPARAIPRQPENVR